LVGSAYELPVEDGSFDTVLCTAVLEHLEEPAAALREARRVLRGGGVAIYTVPFIWHVHEAPRDFFRYSRYGIEHLFGEAGFEIEELRPLSGFWVTFGTMLAYYLHTRRRGPIRFRLYPLITRPLLAAAYRLDRHDPDESWTWAYLVVARAA
ncbi:MAG TPA: methyltransferase domain-containing protein, partial [Thermoleophilaceae bacterium]|nr:methyltransferase domain-containing protein [Thermoleophilaceae bacterium]